MDRASSATGGPHRTRTVQPVAAGGPRALLRSAGARHEPTPPRVYVRDSGARGVPWLPARAARELRLQSTAERRSSVRRAVQLRPSSQPPGLRPQSCPVSLLRPAGGPVPARLQRFTRHGGAAARRRHLFAPHAAPSAPASRSVNSDLPAAGEGTGVTEVSRALTAAFMTAVGLTALRPIGDADFWWLLRAGRYMVETRTFPTTDPFSATAHGAAWLNHAWGFELFIYGVYALAGTTGVILLQGLAASATFGVLYGLLRREGVGQGWSFALLSLGVLATHGFWTPRPQLVTYFILTLFAGILADYQGRRQSRMWWLPVLTAVWANLHAGFLAGPALVALCAAGELVGWALGDDTGRDGGLRRARTLALWAAACVVASMANPFHYHAVLFPFKVIGEQLSQAWIIEWASPPFSHPQVL